MKDQKRLDEHLNNGEIELIMCAAIHVDDQIDHIYQPYNIDKGLVFCGWRHPCIFSQIRLVYNNKYSESIQGFLTTKNRFLNREESLELVKSNGQLKNRLIGGILTSEDLW